MRRSDKQHVGAVRGQRPPAHRSRNDAGEVEHLDAGEWPLGSGQGFGRRVADLLDRKRRQRGDRLSLRVVIPFGERAAGGDDKTGCRRRVFEFFRLPTVERALHRSAIMFAAEQLEQSTAVVRQISVQPHPAPVAAAIKPGDAVVIFGRHLAVDAQVALAAEFDRRRAHVDGDALAAARAQPPQLVRRQCRSGEGCLCGSSDRK